jgi:hypothetical protein
MPSPSRLSIVDFMIHRCFVAAIRMNIGTTVCSPCSCWSCLKSLSSNAYASSFHHVLKISMKIHIPLESESVAFNKHLIVSSDVCFPPLSAHEDSGRGSQHACQGL